MSIRKRLASFTFLMIGFLILLGGLLQLGGPVIIGAFTQSLESITSLNTIRELRFNINLQKNSLNRYLLLDDQSELLRFNEATSDTKKNLKYLRETFKGPPPEWYQKITQSFDDTNSSAEKIMEYFKSGNKSKAYAFWDSSTYPLLQNLNDEAASLEKERSVQVQSLFQKITILTHKVGMIVLVVFVIALITILILFRSLYKAVMNPLGDLKEGAQRFGSGQFDYRIKIPSSNEFGELAEAFNKMAENVSQLQMQAVHMDRMSAVGQLAGGVAHEINNPLTAVLGQTQIMLAKLKEGDPAREKLLKIENAAIRCRKIVRGLLDFSRPTQTKLEQVDINALINATVELCEADLKKSRVNLIRDFDEKMLRIRGNASELQQVILNLINNSIQAMPSGGTITMRTKPNQSIPKGVKLNSEGPYVELTMADTGIGIAQEHINRIFDPFFTTKDIGKGTGLGLSVSTGIIKKHGGDLSVASSGIDRGAVFRIILPTKGPALTGSKGIKV